MLTPSDLYTVQRECQAKGQPSKRVALPRVCRFALHKEVPKTLLAVYAGTEAYSRVLTWNDPEHCAEEPPKLTPKDPPPQRSSHDECSEHYRYQRWVGRDVATQPETYRASRRRHSLGNPARVPTRGPVHMSARTASLGPTCCRNHRAVKRHTPGLTRARYETAKRGEPPAHARCGSPIPPERQPGTDE